MLGKGCRAAGITCISFFIVPGIITTRRALAYTRGLERRTRQRGGMRQASGTERVASPGLAESGVGGVRGWSPPRVDTRCPS